MWQLQRNPLNNCRKITVKIIKYETTEQTQLMTFENEVRQQELAQEKIKLEKQRKQNIQYALIALGIIVLLTLYLSLTHSFISNTKLIQFFWSNCRTDCMRPLQNRRLKNFFLFEAYKRVFYFTGP